MPPTNRRRRCFAQEPQPRLFPSKRLKKHPITNRHKAARTHNKLEQASGGRFRFHRRFDGKHHLIGKRPTFAHNGLHPEAVFRPCQEGIAGLEDGGLDAVERGVGVALAFEAEPGVGGKGPAGSSGDGFEV